MAKNTIGDAPFAPVVLYDMKELFSLSELKKIATARKQGATICLRYPDGPKDRGGYFFHFKPIENDRFAVFDFEKRHVVDLSSDELVAFINHCTGQKFDERSFNLCQSELNFLKDE